MTNQQSPRDPLLAELKASHVIIKNALNLMTIDQKCEWGRQNDAAGLVEFGSTRANERAAAIAAAESAALSQPQSQAQGEAVPYAYEVQTAGEESELVYAAYLDRHGAQMEYESRIPLYAAPVAAQQGMTDAYVGAREDLAIWKKRALEAEEMNRKFMHEINGPTHMGEPVVVASPAALTDEQRHAIRKIRDALAAARRMGVASVVLPRVDEAISDARTLLAAPAASTQQSEPSAECNPADICAGCRCKYAAHAPSASAAALTVPRDLLERARNYLEYPDQGGDDTIVMLDVLEQIDALLAAQPSEARDAEQDGKQTYRLTNEPVPTQGRVAYWIHELRGKARTCFAVASAISADPASYTDTPEEIAGGAAQDGHAFNSAAALIEELAAILAAPSADSAAARDAERYRWLRENRDVLLVTGFFGNGCINRTIEEVDAAIDSAIDAAPEQSE